MDNDIEAIPTRWRGWHFRSRTEARWAVFFTELRIHFEYEPQGFKLSDGTLYLPDFYLPQVDYWAEVKGTWFTPSEDLKAKLLSKSTGKRILFLDGPPDFRSYKAATWDSGEYTICEYSLDVAMWPEYFEHERRLYSQPVYTLGDESAFSMPYRLAVYASRAERFEL